MKHETELTAAINYYLGADDYFVRPIKVTKRNDTVRRGFEIRPFERNVGVCVYCDDILQQVEDGYMTIDVAAMNIVDRYTQLEKTETPQEVNVNIGREFILQNVSMGLINEDCNSQFLADKIWRSFMDLAVVYYIPVDGFENARTTVTLQIADSADLSEPELFKAAKDNMLNRGGYTVRKLSSFIPDSYGHSGDEGNDIYVGTTASLESGATIMLQKSELEKMARLLHGDYYVLPSSVHEIITVPANDMVDVDALREMVSSINASVLEETDFLSNSVYRYNSREKELSIA